MAENGTCFGKQMQVAATDDPEQAYRLGTSRSNLINQILAEHLSCVTPEMRMREIFAQMTELMNSSFRICSASASEKHPLASLVRSIWM